MRQCGLLLLLLVAEAEPLVDPEAAGRAADGTLLLPCLRNMPPLHK
jgi:hypothetical protein